MNRNEPASCSIANLRDHPAFFDTAVERIWQTWFEQEGYPLTHIADQLDHDKGSDSPPFVLVAFQGSTFLGTATVAASARPDIQRCTPYLANVFVEQEHRCQGIGRALINQAVLRTFSLGIKRLYLTTRPENRTFYENGGWRSAGNPVGTEQLVVLAMTKAG